MRRSLAERILADLLTALAFAAGKQRGDWVRAALAESAAEPDGRARLSWLLGIFGMALGDLISRILMPWRASPGEAPPAGFAAFLSAGVLILPFWFIEAVSMNQSGAPLLYAPIAFMLADPGRARLFHALAPPLVIGSLALAAWVNLGVVLRGRHLGGLMFEVSLAWRLLNLGIIGVVACLSGLLFNHLGDAFGH